jgi:hypothetical protein
MNRSLCTLALGLVALGMFLLAANNATATTLYTASFDSDATALTDGAWNSSGGQDGGYGSVSRTGNLPYVTPTSSLFVGDYGSNFGSNEISFSYYLKAIAGIPSGQGGLVQIFADTDATPGWDTMWQRTPSDTSTPTDWRLITWSVDTTASTAPAGWVCTTGSGSWADSWKNVGTLNLWSGTAWVQNTTLTCGLDTVVVQGVPEPSSVVLLGTSLLGLLAYAWRKRK